MLTVTEFADELGVHPMTVRRWLKAGVVRGVQVNPSRGKWRIPVDELERVRPQS